MSLLSDIKKAGKISIAFLMGFSWLVTILVIRLVIIRSNLEYENGRYYDSENGVVIEDIRDVLWVFMFFLLIVSGFLTGIFASIVSRKKS